MDKLLVIGASGFLGNRIMLYAKGKFKTEGTYNPAFDGAEFAHLHSLDICSKGEVERLLDKIRPDIVMLTAAMSNLDACERNPEIAHKVNVNGPQNVAECCKRIDARLIHISSVYVFDGEKKGRYTEGDAPNPISVYGKTKSASENAVSSILTDFLIARPAVLYGWTSANEKDNFVTTIIKNLRSKRPLKVFDDQRSSPTFSDDLAKALLDLSATDFSGTLNISGPDCLSRAECGSIVAETFGLDGSLLLPVPYASVPLPAKRPRNSCLDVSKAERLLGRRMLPFKDGVRNMREREGAQ